VYDRPRFRHRVQTRGVLRLRLLRNRGRVAAGFILVVYDQNSRIASIVGGQRCGRSAGSTRSGGPGCGGQATSVNTGMAVTTPTEADLLEGYDRSSPRGEKQIGSGMLLSTPEAPD
jgi:hypothetical protein